MKSIIFLMPYFGKWPEWFPIYLASCKNNPTIRWHFFTDCPIPIDFPPNVTFSSMTFDNYKKRVRQKLRIPFDPDDPYKICDIRPAFGIIHEEDIKGFDYFGWGDIDVIYGNIRKFYTDQVLSHHVISAFDWGVSGHFALIKNEKWLRSAFRKLPGWKKKFSNPKHLEIDEWLFGLIFRPSQNRILRKIDEILINKYKLNHYFEKQFTTPLTPTEWHDGSKDHPQVWYWKNGSITNNKDGDKEFICLHFMNFKFKRWMDAKYDNVFPWKETLKLIHLSPSEIEDGVRIDRHGFHCLNLSSSIN